MNFRDSEALKAVLEADGHTFVDNESEADLVLLNTCSVRDCAEAKAIGKAGRLLKNKRTNPQYRLGIIGCMAARRGQQLTKLLPQLDWVLPPPSLSDIPHIIQETLRTNTPKVITNFQSYNFACYEQPLPFTPVRWIPIQQGCSMGCSYCIVPHTRGHQQNRPFDSILREAQTAADQGTREIILLGQIVNAYRDNGKTFVDLLHAIQAIDGIERIRFISPHPTFFTNQLIQCFKTLPKCCPSIHLPIQSASNRILQHMHRGYTQETLTALIQALRTIQPQLSLSTDLIVGYPGETDADFEQTVQFFKKIQFDMAYIFKYSPRPNTPAAELAAIHGVPKDVQEKRNQVLLDCLSQSSLRYNQQFVHTYQSVLVEGHAPKGVHKLFGRTIVNKKVIFDGDSSLIGSFQSVWIERATTSVLEGCIKPV